MLEADIKALIAAGASADREAARAVFAALRKGPEWGLLLSTPEIVTYRDSRTDTRTELEAWIR